jgi:hypothetical protein
MINAHGELGSIVDRSIEEIAKYISTIEQASTESDIIFLPSGSITTSAILALTLVLLTPFFRNSSNNFSA